MLSADRWPTPYVDSSSAHTGVLSVVPTAIATNSDFIPKTCLMPDIIFPNPVYLKAILWRIKEPGCLAVARVSLFPDPSTQLQTLMASDLLVLDAFRPAP